VIVHPQERGRAQVRESAHAPLISRRRSRQKTHETERHEHVSLSAVAELSDDELRNAIALLRAAPGPLAEPAGGGKSTDDTAKLN
jgi:hypothetical protein